MIKSNELDFLRALEPSKTVSDFFDAIFGISLEENALLIRHGFWHVAYFAYAEIWTGDSSSRIGVRILPGMSLSEMPVVATNQYGAITISPTLKNLVPNWILHMVIEPGSWESVQSQWSKVEEEIKNIHFQLGGDLLLFERFKNYILDDKNFQTPIYLDEKSRAFEFLKVDQSVETVQFREFIQKLILNETLLPEFPNNFGAWNDYAKSALAFRAYDLLTMKLKTRLETVETIWLGFDKPAPFDSDVFVSQFTISRNPASLIHDLVTRVEQWDQWDTEESRELLPGRIRSDPLFPAFLALDKAKFGYTSAYTGIEHMEAAAKLDLDLNDGKRSYEALISASFWSAMNLGFPYKESYQASLLLARKYGWDEMLELLEMNEFDIQNA
jgi:hypothetical protein